MNLTAFADGARACEHDMEHGGITNCPYRTQASRDAWYSGYNSWTGRPDTEVKPEEKPLVYSSIDYDRYAYRRKGGCHDCGRPCEAGKKRCSACLDTLAEKQMIRRSRST